MRKLIVDVSHHADGQRTVWLQITNDTNGEQTSIVLTENEAQVVQHALTHDSETVRIEY
jgi:hypothetical protein